MRSPEAAAAAPAPTKRRTGVDSKAHDLEKAKASLAGQQARHEKILGDGGFTAGEGTQLAGRLAASTIKMRELRAKVKTAETSLESAHVKETAKTAAAALPLAAEKAKVAVERTLPYSADGLIFLVHSKFSCEAEFRNTKDRVKNVWPTVKEDIDAAIAAGKYP